jgi:signal recognition particle receptor subunit beta
MATGTHDKNNSKTGEFKIVVTGNVGSGKSTSIRVVSKVPVIGTETKASESDTLHRKDTTTVAMEYGMTFIENAKLHLYGTPGQRRFDFMSDVLCKGANAMVVMIDNGCYNPLNEVDYYLKQHARFLRTHPAVIAITHYDDLRTCTSLLDYHRYILDHGFTCPVMRVDARKKPEIERLLLNLLSLVAQGKTGKKTLDDVPERLAA